MSTALRIAHGAFGRVALLDMDGSLVRHAHPHCHVLLKVEGADTQFIVGDKVYPFNADPVLRNKLLNGLDDIAQTLQYAADIAAYEARH